MRRIVLSLAIAASLSGAAYGEVVSPDHVDPGHTATRVQIFAVTLAYDDFCEKLPDAYRRSLFAALRTVSETELHAAAYEVGGYIRREGTRAFCGMLKDRMTNASKE